MIFLVYNTIHADTAALRNFAGTFVFAAKKFLTATAHAGVIARTWFTAAFCKIFLVVLHHKFKINFYSQAGIIFFL